MARVQVINEVSTKDAEVVRLLGEKAKHYPSDGWVLCFQWCRYIYDDASMQYGYRFIWRWPHGEGGGLQAARGQARIPSFAVLRALTKAAEANGWANYDGEDMDS